MGSDLPALRHQVYNRELLINSVRYVLLVMLKKKNTALVHIKTKRYLYRTCRWTGVLRATSVQRCISIIWLTAEVLQVLSEGDITGKPFQKILQPTSHVADLLGPHVFREVHISLMSVLKLTSSPAGYLTLTTIVVDR